MPKKERLKALARKAEQILVWLPADDREARWVLEYAYDLVMERYAKRPKGAIKQRRAA